MRTRSDPARARILPAAWLCPRLAGLALACAATGTPAPAATRPNILLVVADDLNTRIGPYADPSLALDTPHLDRLAAEGVTFSRAYSQYPVCGPSRASFMSGLYPETNGVTTNAFGTANHRIATPALADHPTLAGFLRQHGYYTARVSKIFHVGVPGGIERGETGSDDPDSWDYAVDVMAPETLSDGVLEKLSRGDHYGSNFSRMILPDGRELTQADVLAADQAIAILETRAGEIPANARNRTRLKPDAPFFLAVGFVRPHVPLIAPARHFASYPDGEAWLPPVPADDLDDVPEPARRTANGVAARFGMTPDEQRKAVAAYHASVRFMDEQLGRLLGALDRLGLRESTAVVFTSDHGFNLGEHTAWQKQSLWEESVRVPLIVAPPDAPRAGERSDAVVELIDLYPTLADLAGLSSEAPAILQGESLLPTVAAPSDAAGESIAYTVTRDGGASLRTERWRYNRWGEHAEGENEELYDHDADPGEIRNLARDPANAALLEDLRARFERARSRARDREGPAPAEKERRSDSAAHTVLTGVTLIDGTGSAPLRDAWIAIEGDLIADVGAGALPAHLARAPVVRDLSGTFVVPGFVDTHFHVDTPAESDQELLSTALAFGITSIRDTGPALGKGVTVRARLESGELEGPRMVTTGQIVDRTGGLAPEYPSAATPEEVRAIVREQISQGADGVKLYMWLPPELVEAGIAEAHAGGVAAIGHLKTTSWTDAARMGIDVLVHGGSDGPTWELLPEERRSDFPDLDWGGFFRQWTLTASEIDLDGPRMRALVDALLENDVEVNPTLSLLEALYRGDDTGHLARLEPRHAGAALKEIWGEGWQTGNPFMRRFGVTAAEFAAAREAFQVTLQMTRMFHEAGVRLTAGSDVSMPWVVPGSSFHRELELMERAGIPTADVVQIATRIGAEAIGVIGETGTIEPGKSADLVVLRDDPLRAISNTRGIEMVLFRGREVGAGRDSAAHLDADGG